jgi:diguanylate cyclase (GGDEF)-like protein
VPSLVRPPAQLTGLLEIEWRLVPLRWFGMLFVAPGLWLLHLSSDQIVAGYLILLAAAAYNLFVQLLLPRRPWLFRSGYLTTLGDGLLNAAMLALCGGFDTPLYALLYTITVASAMRYGYGPSSVLTVGFVAFDLLVGRPLGGAPDGAFFVRSSLLVFTGTLTGFLANYLRGQAHQAEAAVQVQLAQAQHAALHDRLTELPNRSLLTDLLAAALLGQAGESPAPLAVLCVDLDRFKEINNTVGHRAGDQVLQEVGRRVAQAVPATATVARVGGSEFAVLLLHADAGSATQTAEAILRALEQPLQIQDVTVDVSGSIGIALAPDHGDDAEILLRRADIALRMAEHRRGDFAIYLPGWDVHSPDRMQLAADLRCAVARDELRLHYQPIVSLRTGRIEEVEALVRWQHPRRGLIPPMQFIPLAEETGMIVPIGQWVLEEACRQAVAWRARFASAEALVMSVNLSARQLQHTDVSSDVSAVLEATGLDPRALKLEITESVAIDDADQGLTSLWLLKGVGVQLAIDDFGTGFSSLGYLKRIPADTIKIDKGFIDGLGVNPEDSAIVAAIIAFARGLGMSTTAEGVEEAEQLAHLRRMGTDRVQGYYFSKPLPAEQLETLFRQQGSLLDTPPQLLRAA